MRETLYLFGCGGHGRSVADVYLAKHPANPILFIDAQAREGERLFGFPVVKAAEPTTCYFFAIGDNEKRSLLFEKWGQQGLISILSPKAYLGRASIIEPGCFVGNFAHVGPQAIIGCNTIVNNGAIIEHEVRLGAHSHVAPGAVISGRCQLGDKVFIGAGAVLKEQIVVCANVIVGAGATVVKSIAEPGIYVGTPAQKVKEFTFR